MRARLERLCGPEIARDLWVGTFHATCAKLLRALRRGASALERELRHLRRGRSEGRSSTRALKDLDLDEKRYPPRAVLARIHKHKQEGARARTRQRRTRYVDDVALAKLYRRYEEQLARGERGRLRGPHPATSLRLLEETPTRATTHPPPLRLRAGRRVPGHERHAVPLPARARRATTGTSASSATTTRASTAGAAPTCATSATSGATIPDATVVKLEQNYRSTRASSRRRSASSRGRASASRRSSGPRTSRRRADRVVAARRRARRGGVRRRVDPARRAPRGSTSAGDRRLLPHPRPVARARRGDARREPALPDHRRHEVLRARRGQGRARRTCASCVNPRSDVDLLRIINVPARGIGADDGGPADARGPRAERHLDLRRARPPRRGRRDRGAAAKKKLAGVPRAAREAARREALSSSPQRDRSSRCSSETGYRAGAREGGQRRERRAPREPAASSSARSRTTRPRREAAGEEPTLSGFLERVTLAERRRRAIEGRAARVALMTVHGAKGLEFEHVLLTGMEEEMFPYRAMDPGRARGARGGAAPRVRGDHARAQAPRDDAHARCARSSARRAGAGRAGSSASCPAEAIVHKATRAAAASAIRAVRPARVARADRRRERRGVTRRHRASRAPAARSARDREPGERFVDHEFFDDRGDGDRHAAAARVARRFTRASARARCAGSRAWASPRSSRSSRGGGRRRSWRGSSSPLSGTSGSNAHPPREVRPAPILRRPARGSRAPSPRARSAAATDRAAAPRRCPSAAGTTDARASTRSALVHCSGMMLRLRRRCDDEGAVSPGERPRTRAPAAHSVRTFPSRGARRHESGEHFGNEQTSAADGRSPR